MLASWLTLLLAEAPTMPQCSRETTRLRCDVRCNTTERNLFCTKFADERSGELAQHMPRLPFYIHQDGAFNSSSVVAVLQQIMAGRPMDIALPVGEAQYLVDLPLMPALERHPLRTSDPDAAGLHIIGAMPYASQVLAKVTNDHHSHMKRMDALADQLLRNKAFLNREKPFLLVFCSCSANGMGRKLLSVLGRGNLIVASCDPYFARDYGKLPKAFALAYRRGVTLPHYPHSMAHEPRGPSAAPATNKTGIMFHGGLGRYDHGLRDSMLTLIAAVKKKGKLRVDTKTGEMTRGINRSAHTKGSYAHSAQSFLDASMCLVPSGDAPSSRRLFDAMAAGCVPVLVRSRYRLQADSQTFTSSLPFPLTIDWRAATLSFSPIVNGATRCTQSYIQPYHRAQCKHRAACTTTMVKWFHDWHDETNLPCALEETRERSRTAFRDHLDFDRNPESIVWALLREIEHRLPNCDMQHTRSKSPVSYYQEPGKSRRPTFDAGRGSVDDRLVCPYDDSCDACMPRCYPTCKTASMKVVPSARRVVSFTSNRMQHKNATSRGRPHAAKLGLTRRSGVG